MTATDGKSAELDRSLTLEVVRVSEQAAIAAARFRGRGDEQAADLAAANAMHRELCKLPIRGRVIIGAGPPDEVAKLFVGEEIGEGPGPSVDIAVDPLEGTTLCAKNLMNSLSVLALAEEGTLLSVPDVYMDKIAVGPGYPDDVVDLDADPADNIVALAKAKGVLPREITACILDRPRHEKLIAAVRRSDASVRLISDGDVAGIIHTTDPGETGIDIYFGIGGAPEGVLAAAALRCIGGQMQARLHPLTDADRRRADAAGFTDRKRAFRLKELASGSVFFAATGVTDSPMLRGVRFVGGVVETDTVVLRSATRTVRWIKARHGNGGS